jgi:DNA adenine methylase
MVELANTCRSLNCGFALSMWNQNIFRKDELLWELLGDFPIRIYKHFYHVGSSENYRHAIEEALVIKHGYESAEINNNRMI